MLWVVLIASVLVAGLYLGTLYLTGRHIMFVEAQRDAYKRIALLAIEDAAKVQGALDEVLDAILEATKPGATAKAPKKSKVDKSWD